MLGPWRRWRPTTRRRCGCTKSAATCRSSAPTAAPATASPRASSISSWQVVGGLGNNKGCAQEAGLWAAIVAWPPPPPALPKPVLINGCAPLLLQGHSVWIRMRKPLPAPAHLAAAQPEQQSIPVAVASGAAAVESPFEDVALEAAQPAPAAQPAAARIGCFGRRQPQPATAAARAAAAAGDSETGMTAPPAPGIHTGSLLRKLSNGASVLGALPASQGPTPRIGAVPAPGFAAAGAPAAYDRASSLKEGGGYTQLELRAMPASSDGGAAHSEPAKLFAAAGAGVPAPAGTASVASVDSDSDNESDGEKRPRARIVLLCSSQASARCCCSLHAVPATHFSCPMPLPRRPCRHFRCRAWRRILHDAPARGQPAWPGLNLNE